MVKLEETRIAVLIPATATGSSKGSGGQVGGSTTTRRKKYEAKKAPKSITSETMKSRIPSVWRSIRELWCSSCACPRVAVALSISAASREHGPALASGWAWLASPANEADAAHRRVRWTQSGASRRRQNGACSRESALALLPLGDGGGHDRGGTADLEVLNRLVGDLTHLADQVLLEPA